jgi:hypothetical protein
VQFGIDRAGKNPTSVLAHTEIRSVPFAMNLLSSCSLVSFQIPGFTKRTWPLTSPCNRPCSFGTNRRRSTGKTFRLFNSPLRKHPQKIRKPNDRRSFEGS